MCLCVQLYAAVSTTGIPFVHNLIIPNNSNVNNSIIRDMYVFNSLEGRSEYWVFFNNILVLLQAGYVQKLKKNCETVAIFIYLKF